MGADLFRAFIRQNSAAGRALAALAERGRNDLAERWQDEASEAALNGNPQRARYLEDWVRRIGGVR